MPLLPTLPAWSIEHGLVPLLLFVESTTAPRNVLVVGFLLAAACVVRGQVRASVFVATTVWLTSYATTELKQVFGRERPPWQLGEHVHNGGSFPSGHSAAAAALVGVVVVLSVLEAGTVVQRRQRARLALMAGAVALLVVGADRVLLGRHYPTDVLAGFVLAGVITVVVAFCTGIAPRVLTGAASLRDGHRATPDSPREQATGQQARHGAGNQQPDPHQAPGAVDVVHDHRQVALVPEDVLAR
ncbi:MULTISPECIES: phosphatase PAP2 family protein [unclassified Nocardioides]|uniref:phosphatase PAP2 family protein n=1 Tax=unclassified Nocardioides TaxID=2615069 RepID=UPI00070067EF|nr:MULTISPECIES: phosphatase PAP2 family protein [unclassified Nocardioides]KRA38611.1 hypothetical protein ASD81_08380 [Nocardioides sp. Root614]KRA92571.1 hypothetical protein ASD84_08645 [Nocardioides sp. Root682]